MFLNIMRVIFLLTLVLLCAAEKAPASDSTKESWKVLSHLIDPDFPTRPASVVEWLYTPVSSGEGYVVSVRDAENALSTHAVLHFTLDFSLIEVEVAYTIRAKERILKRSFAADEPAVFLQSLMPVSMPNMTINPHRRTSTRSAIMTKSLPGAVFRDTFVVTQDTFSVAEARQQGMLSNASPTVQTNNLVRITYARKQDGNAEPKTVLQQLWSPDFFFWLYEETEVRKSWFVDE